MVEIDGIESLATTLEWLAQQMRAGFVRGVSLELSHGKGRLSVQLDMSHASGGEVPDAVVQVVEVEETREPDDPKEPPG